MNFQGLLVVSKESWNDTRWARKQWLPYYLSQLDAFEKVVYLDRHSAWWRGECAHQPAHHQKIEVVQEELLVPLENHEKVRQWNRQRIATRMVEKLDPKLRWSAIYYHPFDVPMMQILGTRSKTIFDWTEDWSVFHVDTDISELQIKAVKSADAVITVTRQLYERAATIRGNNDHLYHIPNATVFERSDELAMEPNDINSLAHPRIGFIGHAGPWFDEHLVGKIARERPDWNWVMVGGCSESAKQQLDGLPNVHWQGVRSPEMLMSFMQHCDVLVAPYKTGIEGDATKLYDYLVAAKPILSVPCETATRLQPWVTVCQSSSEWISELDGLLSEDGLASFIPCPEDVVHSHHWGARAVSAAKVIEDLSNG